MFKPQDYKALNNPYKILKQRYEHQLENTVKGYIEETANLQGEINYNLYNLKID